MATNFGAQPYFDDFDGTKNFQRILFKPGIAVQARELTQLQTALQEQITRFGNHVFTHGSIVLNSERVFESDLVSIPCSSALSQNMVGQTIIGDTTGTKALVKAVSISTKRLIVKLTSGTAFSTTENVHYIVNVNGSLVTESIILNQAAAFGKGMIFSVNSGVIYVNGNFVYNEKQTIILSDEFSDTSHVVGFKVTENIITHDEDSSLLDNAQGSPNFAAPGADRFNINLELVSLPVESNSRDFIEIASIRSGKLATIINKTIYSELEKEFARRTFDESGNYTVRPFHISIQDHVSSSVIRPNIVGGVITSITILEVGELYTSVPTVTISGTGVGADIVALIDNNIKSDTYQQLIGFNIISGGSGYVAGETFARLSGDVNKLSAKLEAGKAYVKGFEFETTAPSYLSIDKARSSEHADNLDVQVAYGNYLYVTLVRGLFDMSSFETVELHSVTETSVTSSATKLGTAKVAFFNYVSGTVGSGTEIYKMYLCDITIDSGKLFTNVESIVVDNGDKYAATRHCANINNLSKFGGDPAADVFLSGTDRTSLVFPLNHAYVKELRDAQGIAQNDYTFKRVITASVSGGTGSIATDNGLERFVGGAGAYSADVIKNNYIFVITVKGTSSYNHGDIISPTVVTGGAISSGAIHSLSFTFASAGSFTVAVYASINANAQTEKIKSLQPYTLKIISSPNTVKGQVDSIGIADIHKVLAIYKTASNPSAATVDGITGAVNFGAIANTNVTANYSVDNGQRDFFYDHGGIKLIGTAPLVTDYLVIVYNNFTHTNAGFAAVGSYSIPYESIPEYTSVLTGKTYSLSDCLDFRPRRADNATTFNSIKLPNPDVQFNTDYAYYLGRIDTIVARASKSFDAIQGISAVVPKAPLVPSDCMSLFVLELPPYTEKLSDISIKYIENKRYTMEDIGKLEKRIETVEYYTQLNLLEKQAKDESILDSSNMEKFKNGFFVDSFTTNTSLENTADGSAWSRQIWGWWNNRVGGVHTWNKGASRVYASSISDSLSMDYKIATDPLNAELRPEAITEFREFIYSSGTNTAKNGDLISLNFTETTLIKNSWASKTVNVNPFDVIAFIGMVQLTPSSDTWVETNTLPAVNKIVNVQLPDAATVYRTVDSGIDVGSGNAKSVVTISTSSRVDVNVVGVQKSSLGSAVVDVQYIPYARPRTVLAVCEKFKPLSRLFVFIEGIAISQFCQPLPTAVVTGHIGTLFDSKNRETVSFRTGSSTGTIVGTAEVILYSPPSTTTPANRTLTFTNFTGTYPDGCFVTSTNGGYATVVSSSTPAMGAQLIPDEFGYLGLAINIQQNSIRTGLRQIRFIDNIDNVEFGAQSTGSATYFSEGILQSKQETLLTTRSIQNHTVVTTLTKDSYYWVDPLAQTFMVDSEFNPNGLHVTSIDLFFKTKSNTVPVSLEITRTINGYPESVITSIPFALITLNPEQVNVSDDGSVLTKFKFKSPIHLNPGEYAMTIKANTRDYEVFVGEMNRTDILTGALISKQPYNGVLFKSQNASSWEASSNEDLKFNLNIATFESAGSAVFSSEYGIDALYSLMHINTSNIVPSGTKLVWSYKGLNVGSPDVMDTEYIQLPTNVDLAFSSVRKAAAQGTILLKADLTSTSSKVSPVIDIEGLSVILVHNSINMTSISGTDLEETDIGGDALAKYVSKKVRLADGFDASNIVVTIDAYKPTGTDVRVYYKVSPTESAEQFEAMQWVRMATKEVVATSTSEVDYKEHKFYPTNTFGAYGVPIDNPISPRFNIFAIKIVLVSSSAAIVPRVRDLRAIALES